MGNKTKEGEPLKTVDDRLKTFRIEIVTLSAQIAKAELRISMVTNEFKRIESATLLEVSRAKLDNGRNAYAEEWSRKSRVEEILAKHERFNSLFKRHNLLQKLIVRKQQLLDVARIEVESLASRADAAVRT